MKRIFTQKHIVKRSQKEANNPHRGLTLWLTGLPSSGKSTIANRLEKLLFSKGAETIILDGDNVRGGLNSDLGFSKKDRKENIRRVGEVAKILTENGLIAIVSFVSPFRADRNNVRARMKKGEFIEVFMNCDPKVCGSRDTKGLYKLAHKGKVKDFTGVSSPYERPLKPELEIDTAKLSVKGSVEKIYDYLKKHKYLRLS